jgi:twinkle protein
MPNDIPEEPLAPPPTPGPAPAVENADTAASSRTRSIYELADKSKYRPTFVSSFYQIDETEIRSYFERKGLIYRTNHSEFILQYCPTCPDHKGKLDNMWKLYVSRSSGTFICHRCGNKVGKTLFVMVKII